MFLLCDCSLNICRKQDTRDSKNKYVIAIYTDVDCLSMLFEEEQELKTWLIHLLRLQKDPDGSTVDDGKIPRPKFENMWQIIVKSFKAEDPQNRFVMEGHYRLCVTEEDLKFFPIGSTTPLRFEITCLRSCLFRDRMFQISAGRGAPSGAGVLGIQCDDAEIAANLNRAVLEAKNTRSKNPIKLPQHVIDSMRRRQEKAEAEAQEKAAAGSGSAGTSASSSSHHSRSQHDERSSSSKRPRAESCSEIDRSTFAGAAGSSTASRPKVQSAASAHHPPSSSSSSHRHDHSASSIMRRFQGRTRTTSEGHHPRLGVGGKSGSLVSSGSPLSPSPGSCVSSESAGSSNSLDESEFHHEKRHCELE